MQRQRGLKSWLRLFRSVSGVEEDGEEVECGGAGRTFYIISSVSWCFLLVPHHTVLPCSASCCMSFGWI